MKGLLMVLSWALAGLCAAELPGEGIWHQLIKQEEIDAAIGLASPTHHKLLRREEVRIFGQEPRSGKPLIYSSYVARNVGEMSNFLIWSGLPSEGSKTPTDGGNTESTTWYLWGVVAGVVYVGWETVTALTRTQLLIGIIVLSAVGQGITPWGLKLARRITMRVLMLTALAMGAVCLSGEAYQGWKYGRLEVDGGRSQQIGRIGTVLLGGSVVWIIRPILTQSWALARKVDWNQLLQEKTTTSPRSSEDDHNV